MNLFSTRDEILNARDMAAVRALTDIATIGILQERSARKLHTVNQQLEHALNSRILIEQAKGVLSAAHNISMDAAFKRLRDYSRNHQKPLRAVAQAIATGAVHPRAITAQPIRQPRQ